MHTAVSWQIWAQRCQILDVVLIFKRLKYCGLFLKSLKKDIISWTFLPSTAVLGQMCDVWQNSKNVIWNTMRTSEVFLRWTFSKVSVCSPFNLSAVEETIEGGKKKKSYLWFSFLLEASQLNCLPWQVKDDDIQGEENTRWLVLPT